LGEGWVEALGETGEVGAGELPLERGGDLFVVQTVKTAWGQRLIPLAELECFLEEHLEPPREPGERGSAGRPPSLPRRVVERILTTFDLDEYVYEALRAGTSGFLLKDAGADELVHAVRVIAAGEALLSPSITRRLIADYARRPPTREQPAALAELTPR
jgi:hypothetical protein